jgi:hypothetical protein
MYAMATTWPDTAYAIRVLFRYIHDPTKEYMIALNRVFWYIKGMKYWRLHFRGALRGPLGGVLERESALRCYVNSDYGGHPNDYKSRSELVGTIAGAVHG